MNRLIFCCFLLVNCLHAQRDPTRLTDGPMLGDVTANSVRIWGRTSDPSEFFVRYGTDKTSMIQISEGVMTSISHDNTGSIILNGLRPDTRYHYQLWVNERPHGESGTFKTLPDSGSLIDPEHNPEGLFNFKFQIGSCANQNPLHGIGHQTPTYETLNRDWSHRVDFHIMNGDWLYEELRDYPLEAWRLVQDVALNAVPDPLQWMPTVIGVWENYKLYLRRNHDLSDWHRNVPSYFTFDDHELVNDIWGTGTAGKRHRRTVFRDIGTYAWYDYLGWANPTAHDAELHVGRGSMKAGSDLLTDSTVDFTQMPLNEMLNLHVHWDTPEAGVNDMKYDNDDGGVMLIRLSSCTFE